MKDKVIPYDEPYTFQVKLKHLEEGKLIIGIVDWKNQLLERTSYNSKNAVAYSSMFGTIYHGEGTKETGLSANTGMIVTVHVYLKMGRVSWTVDGSQIGEIDLEWIKNRSREFVPYL